MSDDGVVNIEEDGPEIPAATPDAPPVAAAPDVPAETPDQPAEVDAVEVGGQKYVPVGAVIAERKQRQAAEKVAARVNELEEYARDSKPYVDFLRANPGLISGRQHPPAPAQPPSPDVDPNAELIAKTMDLYTPEGKPDLARGAVMSGMVRAVAQQIAQQTIAPIQEESAQTRSARNFQVALQIKDKQGRSPSQAALTQIWRTMDPRQTADPNVASILALTALGLDSVNNPPAPQAPSLPPIVSEGQGGSARRAPLSVLEQSVARDRGIPEAKWAENTKGFTPGRAQQLED